MTGIGDVTFSSFDTAEYLETEDDIASFLETSGEGNEPAAIALALGAVARARNMSQLARVTGITRVGLYKALSPGGNPSLDTIVKVANALGFSLSFRPIGAVEHHSTALPVSLGKRQRAIRTAQPIKASRTKG